MANYSMKQSMKRISAITGIAGLLIFGACTKEYSVENGGNVNNPQIVGTDCRIMNITSYDSANIIPLSSMSATINLRDTVTSITQFDSLGNNLMFFSVPAYAADTIFIDPDQYFVTTLATGRVIKLHGLYDPTNPGSQFDADYVYDVNGNLVQKIYNVPISPINPALVVDYTYVSGNLTHMTSTDMTVPQIIADADLDYFTDIAPKNYLTLMPDEGRASDFNRFAQYAQFYNFGKKPVNAVRKIILRDYVGGAVVDSTVSTFSTYLLSRDNYVLGVTMRGNDQASIPAEAGKLRFTYKCK